MNVMSKTLFVRKYDRNTQQSLGTGKKSAINIRFWLSFLPNESDTIRLRMKVKLITSISHFKHTTWRSLLNIFYVSTLSQNDARI